MQGKGIVRFFLILLTAICIYQLFFFVPANRVESDAEAYATSVLDPGLSDVERTRAYNDAYRAYLDSMSGEKVWSLLGIRDYTYTDVKEQQVKLGLDLKGGMSAVMQVDLRSFLENLSDGNTDPLFVQSLDEADAQLANAQDDYITLFVDAFRQNAAGARSLASVFSDNDQIQDQGVTFQSDDGEVALALRSLADEVVQTTYTLLRQRIDRTGTIQPNVTLDESRDLILVELPGVDNPARVRDILSKAAALDFYDVYTNGDQGILQGIVAANDALKAAAGDVEVEPEFEYVTNYAFDSLGNVDSSVVESVDTIQTNLASNAGPLLSIMQLANPGQGVSATVGYVAKADKRKLEAILGDEVFTSAMPDDVQLAVGQKPLTDPGTNASTGVYAVYALRLEPDGTPALSGTEIAEADQTIDVNNGGQVEVNITMNPEGARRWAEITTQNVGQQFAIVLDGEVLSAPNINEPITGGRSRITGGFTVQEAQDLASNLEVGRLPADTRIIQEAVVGPTLGADNIRSSTIALAAGFILVMVFMALYYSGAGVVSIVALLANVFFIFGALSSFGTVLTLPGIAGIVLTIGMAVDANVIIYERIREELRAGKPNLAAIKDGFQQSLSAILDANVTTLLTALVLNYWGLGPIKGFAVVLIIGIFTSLFTAVLVTRLIIDWRTDGGRALSFANGWSANLLSNITTDWMSKRRTAYAISAVLVVASLVSILTRGFDLGVDFQGGRSYNVEFVGADVDRDALETALTTAFDNESTVVKSAGGENTFAITTSYLKDGNVADADSLVQLALYEGVSQVQPGIDEAAFGTADQLNATRIVSSAKVGPTIADDIRNSSFKAGLVALILIFFYLFIRFSRWEFSLGAVAALFHDVIIVLGVFSIFQNLLPFSLEVDQAFIAAILTVIGYSVNDTVIVYDRIREFINTYTGRSKEEIFNLAINSTLNRTLITSATTLLVVLILFLFGGGSIRGFAFAILCGIAVGTYSSIFIASALVNDTIKDINAKRETVVVEERTEPVAA